ncbi:MAG: photosynthetic complex putative assembly protein PuhB [Pseudomonadota bacterium]
MNYIYNDDDFATEPKRGLPALLPRGEFILWQGGPNWRMFARQAYRTHLIGTAVLAGALTQGAAALASGQSIGLAAGQSAVIVAFGLVGLAILYGIAKLVEKTTVYTITNRRIVLRVGVAIQKTFSIPFAQIDGAQVNMHGRGGFGSICVQFKPGVSIAYLILWPHARPWRLGRTEPMLRAIPQAEKTAMLLGEALRAFVEQEEANTVRSATALSANSKGALGSEMGPDAQNKRLPPLAPSKPYVGRRPAMLAFGVAIAALLFVGIHSLLGDPVRSIESIQPSFQQSIVFTENTDQTIAIIDPVSGQTLTTMPAQGEGLLRAAIRGLGRSRTAIGAELAEPYELRRLPNDGMYLFDPQTGRDIRLDSFGPTQTGALADLLALGL